MDEIRFSRLEARVDEIKDDVAEVKAQQMITSHNVDDLKGYIKEQTEIVKSHVTGDDKIITEIGPIIEEFRYQQERKKRRIESAKIAGLKLSLVSGVVGIIVGIFKIFTS